MPKIWASYHLIMAQIRFFSSAPSGGTSHLTRSLLTFVKVFKGIDYLTAKWTRASAIEQPNELNRLQGEYTGRASAWSKTSSAAGNPFPHKSFSSLCVKGQTNHDCKTQPKTCFQLMTKLLCKRQSFLCVLLFSRFQLKRFTLLRQKI